MEKKLKILKDFIDDGIYKFGYIFREDECDDLYNEILKKRNFNENIFLTEDEYNNSQVHKGVNPENNCSLYDKLNTCFILNNEKLNESLSFMLGNDYEIVINKLICGVPNNIIPEYVQKKINNINIANLGAFIRPEYRDITYFRGIDYHQDMIDWPKGTDLDPSTFITVYVYIHDVDNQTAPLHILPKSHKFGGTLFPHNLINFIGNEYKYIDNKNRIMDVKSEKMIGKKGYCAMWHSCLLHGTTPTEANKLRLSVRLLLAKKITNKNITGIDVVNSSIDGDLSLDRTRFDISEIGKPLFHKNIINNSEK
jgi:hypothetical protein